MSNHTDVKQVRPEEIQSYALAAKGCFDIIEEKVIAVTTAAGALPYSGERADEFKQALTEQVQNFSNIAVSNMQEMSRSIKQNTEFITQALGGAEITLEPPTEAISVPAAEKSVTGLYSADKVELDGYQTLFTDAFAIVVQEFTKNGEMFQELGASGAWVGEEFVRTDGVMESMTSSSVTASNNAAEAVNAAMVAQLKDLGFL